jgi:predicted unusual protein kinase regulating ubiquinone biosynthesis (AarF/ABC1/UbiB family)
MNTATEKALEARYRRILRFAALLLAQSWWFEIFLPQIGLGSLGSRNPIKRLTHAARNFHDLAADLGGLMVKVGQFLSSRLDVLPVEITRELSGLQDEVPPQPFESISETIAAQLGIPTEVAFASIDPNPIAAASLGQAYRAKLSPGLATDLGMQDVVVKVLRPGIEEIVEADLKALRRIGQWLSRVRLVSRRTDAPALVEEFAKTTLDEINYFTEAGNLERFAKDFAQDPYVSTPAVVWERSARKVLTLTDVSAIKIGDIDSLEAAGISPSKVAAELARVTFEQFFVTGFFHADPHPGNIFVRHNGSEFGADFTLVFIDFGMMGQINDAMRLDLQRFLFAVGARDARAWVAASESLGLLLPTADAVVLEDAVAKLFKRFGGLKVGDAVQIDPREIRAFAVEFSEIIRTLPFQLPNDFLFLIRALSLISGVASTLNIEFNIWEAVDPFARSLLSGNGRGLIKQWGANALQSLQVLAGLPQRLELLTTRIERGEVVLRNPELERRVQRVSAGLGQVTSVMVFGVLLFAGITVMSHNPGLGYTLIGVSTLPLFAALWRGRIGR